MVDTREKFREMLNDIAERDGVKRFNKLAELTGISVNTFTNIKKNEVKDVSIDTFHKLNVAFGNRYNIKWFQGDSPYMTVKEMLEAKDRLSVSQIMPDSPQEIIASLKREMDAKEESYRNQLAAKQEIIDRIDKQLSEKDDRIADKEQTIKDLRSTIADLRHQLAQRMTKEELADWHFPIGVAEHNKKQRKRT